VLAAVLYCPVGFYFYEFVISRRPWFQFKTVEVFFIDDPPHIGNGIVLIGDLRHTEYGVVVIWGSDNGRIEVAVFRHDARDLTFENKVVGKIKGDLLSPGGCKNPGQLGLGAIDQLGKLGELPWFRPGRTLCNCC